ncbi:Txe/YoeB family addiction module toxin [Epilithonimonas sp. JDS]|uniref:Txe/YoeB family addiction module toxin n=1 Tax=Epilithonimonas sp. JDS TaxID=2902797 RepID=UPI001E2B7CD8|nr:Txe/YoeB family addiction module toxin [Epilithonimonas sp. JDS]MCD9854773.1 Txe/YoeB family addiction module toxin [Epilithonimonas sp. JDS]
MGKFRLKIEELAENHIKKIYKSGNQGNIKKIEKILLELSETPYSGTGQPEQLKHQLTGYWSRKINQKDRIVYRVDEDKVIVFIISAIGHYEDK